MPAWTHRIILNGADITAQTGLGAQVDEGENVSHVCDVTWYPPSGAQESDALILQTLAIDVDVGAGWQPIFSGRVIRAVWATKERLYRIRGSNRLQEHFRAMGDESAVLAALPGAVYSDPLFGEPPDDLWEYAERCMETIEDDVHLDRAGALVQIPWAAKDTPDHALNGDDIHNAGAFSLIRPDADQLTNRIDLEYDYRVQRWKVRQHALSWSAWRNNVSMPDWCTWAVGPATGKHFWMPTVSLVRNTMSGGSWSTPGGVAYSTHPQSGANYCGATWVWIRWENSEEYALTASSTGYRALTQSVWEQYRLTVTASAAQALYGATVTQRRSGSTDAPAGDEWPPAQAQSKPGWAVDAIGDSYEDQADETTRANDLQAGYQWAARTIRGANRQTNLIVRTDLRPDISLADTVSVDAYGLVATGSKVSRLRYVLSAAPYLELTLAVSRGGGGTTTPWSVPSRPDTTDPGYPAPPSNQSYNTYVGGWDGAEAAPVPDTRLGWVVNLKSNVTDYDSNAEQYTDAFRIQWPEIEDEAAQELEKTVPSTWDLAVDQDGLTIE